MDALSAPILARRRSNSDESCPGHSVVCPERDRSSSQADEVAAPSAIDVDGVGPGPCAPGMARKEPYRDVLAGVPGPTPSTAVALGAVDEVERESAYKPGSVENSHSSAMRVAAHL